MSSSNGRTVHSVSVLFAALVGTASCTQEVVDGESAFLAEAEQDLVISTGALWPKDAKGVANIEICTDPTYPSTATEQARVKAALARSWQQVAKIQFDSSWSVCPNRTGSSSWTLVSDRPGNGRASIGHSSNNWAGMDFSSSLIAPTAIHEFGHVLALWHEQVRSDTPNSCTAEETPGERRSQPAGTTNVGTWDAASIMNYCNANWTNGILSPGDVAGIRAYYGARARRADQDGDGRAEIAVLRPSSMTWFFRNSSAAWFSTAYGVSGDLPAPADYDGDGRIDIAVFRPSLGKWWLRTTTAGWTNGLAYGQNGDVPAPADYDGDGKADIAVFRPSVGKWWLRTTTDSWTNGLALGQAGDIPVPGDYDGDSKADVAVFRPSNATWYVRRSTGGTLTVQYGVSTDIPVPRDYDGDGKVDIAVFRSGQWFLRNTTDPWVSGLVYGTTGDLPAPADYDGDGRTDPAVFRPSTGKWYIRNTTLAWVSGVAYGTSGDRPVGGM